MIGFSHRDPLGQALHHGVEQPLIRDLVHRAAPYAAILPPAWGKGNAPMIHGLPDLDPSPAQHTAVADQILAALGEPHAYPFYLLVARKIPAPRIRQVLAEIEVEGVRSPARVFTYRMQQYALQQYKKQVYTRSSAPQSRPKKARGR